MRRILRDALATFLASSVLGVARPALAQAPIVPIASAPVTENAQPAAQPAAPRSLDAQGNELRLPTIAPAKPPLPVIKGGGKSAMSWESEVKKEPAATVNAPKKPDAKPAAKPDKKNKPVSFASEKQPASSGVSSPALTAPTMPMRWQRPVTSEESEPPIEPPAKLAKPTTLATATPLPPARPAVLSARNAPNSGRARMSAPPPAVRLDRPSRWPPAYDVRPPGRSGEIVFEDESANGRPGVIAFEDEPEQHRVAKAPVVPASLNRQVKSVCGRQARDVLVEPQRDGSVLVTVKVKAGNPSQDDRLTRSILAIPEMTAPNVRLMMEVGP